MAGKIFVRKQDKTVELVLRGSMQGSGHKPRPRNEGERKRKLELGGSSSQEEGIRARPDEGGAQSGAAQEIWARESARV
jgi:hypothetical protein